MDQATRQRILDLERAAHTHDPATAINLLAVQLVKAQDQIAALRQHQPSQGQEIPDDQLRAAVEIFQASDTASRESGALSSLPAEPGSVVPQSTPDGPGASERLPGDEPIDFDGTLAALGREARYAVEHLAVGLRRREVVGDDWKHLAAHKVVDAALGHIDRLNTALDEATQGELLEADFDGLTADQEIRARALHTAAGSVSLSFPPEQMVDDTLHVAARFEAYIRDGAPREHAGGARG